MQTNTNQYSLSLTPEVRFKSTCTQTRERKTQMCIPIRTKVQYFKIFQYKNQKRCFKYTLCI